MGHQEPGSSAAYPLDYTVPDDGDSENAASVSVAFEAIADRTEWLREHLRVPKLAVFTADSTWTAPANLDGQIELEACGGGGGGAGGGGGTTTYPGGSGGGGGGAESARVRLTVTPGVTYNLGIGAGGASGAGGAASVSGTDGGNGGPTWFGGTNFANALIRWWGAEGGDGGLAATPPSGYVAGGRTNYILGSTGANDHVDTNAAAHVLGHGGAGALFASANGKTALVHGGSRTCSLGGSAGANGTVNGTKDGGAGGGGGGAGPFPGADGANGGAGGRGGGGVVPMGNTGEAGAAGSTPSATSYGAGGGGGGAGGAGIAAGGAGGAGGVGMSGVLIVRWYEKGEAP